MTPKETGQGPSSGTQATLGEHVLVNALTEFRGLKKLAERALEQVDDAAFFDVPAPEGNSIAIVVKHLAGNLRSRWTDFLTTDGEKPDRNRDTEFEAGDEDTREALMGRWQAGWNALFEALEPLRAEDLQRTISIRGEPHTVLAAIHRQLTHYGNHVGQIVLLAKHARGAAFRSLSIPRGQSPAFNQSMENKFGR